MQYFDACLTNWANIVEKEKNIRLHDYPGAGAAGGMGGALIAFLNGQFNQGIDLVLEAVHFNEQLSGASFVVTGEGNLIDKLYMERHLMESLVLLKRLEFQPF